MNQKKTALDFSFCIKLFTPFKNEFNSCSSTTRLNEHLKNKHNLFNPKLSKNQNKSAESELDVSKANQLPVLLMFIITACLPFRCVYFKEFCSMLNKNFVIPERRFLSKLASEVYTAKKESLIQSLKEVKTINITTD